VRASLVWDVNKPEARGESHKQASRDGCYDKRTDQAAYKG
jgi:hypothetical protein